MASEISAAEAIAAARKVLEQFQAEEDAYIDDLTWNEIWALQAELARW